QVPTGASAGRAKRCLALAISSCSRARSRAGSERKGGFWAAWVAAASSHLSGPSARARYSVAVVVVVVVRCRAPSSRKQVSYLPATCTTSDTSLPTWYRTTKCWLGEASRPASPAFRTVRETRRLTRLLSLPPLVTGTQLKGSLPVVLADGRHHGNGDAAARCSTAGCCCGPRPCGAAPAGRLLGRTVACSAHTALLAPGASRPRQGCPRGSGPSGLPSTASPHRTVICPLAPSHGGRSASAHAWPGCPPWSRSPIAAAASTASRSSGLPCWGAFGGPSGA